MRTRQEVRRRSRARANFWFRATMHEAIWGILVILAALLWATPATGQNRILPRDVDAVDCAAAGKYLLSTTTEFQCSPLTAPNSSTLPATCSIGEVYHDSDAAKGARLNLCTSTNTWTAVDEDGAGSVGYVFNWGAIGLGNPSPTDVQCYVLTGADTDREVLAVIFEGTTNWPSGVSDVFGIEAKCSSVMSNCFVTLSSIGGGTDYFQVDPGVVQDIYVDTSATSLPASRTIMRVLVTVAGGNTITLCAGYWTRFS